MTTLESLQIAVVVTLRLFIARTPWGGPRRGTVDRLLSFVPAVCVLTLFYYGVFLSTYTALAPVVLALAATLLALVCLYLIHLIPAMRGHQLTRYIVAAAASILLAPFHPVTASTWVIGIAIGWRLAADKRRSPGRGTAAQFTALTLCFWFFANAIWQAEFDALNVISLGLNTMNAVFCTFNFHIALNEDTGAGKSLAAAPGGSG